MLVRFRAGDREIAFGLPTTKAESDAVLAQRFRVYQRWGLLWAAPSHQPRHAPRQLRVPARKAERPSPRRPDRRERAGFQSPERDAFDFSLLLESETIP
jgi:phenylpropionate dioxygenase-like ring-hydroxylating dioxygenase large terminal subunit